MLVYEPGLVAQSLAHRLCSALASKAVSCSSEKSANEGMEAKKSFGRIAKPPIATANEKEVNAVSNCTRFRQTHHLIASWRFQQKTLFRHDRSPCDLSRAALAYEYVFDCKDHVQTLEV